MPDPFHVDMAGIEHEAQEFEGVHVLENAVTTVYENGEAIDTPRFAFSVLGQ